jgi:hypothetical protein
MWQKVRKWALATFVAIFCCGVLYNEWGKPRRLVGNHYEVLAIEHDASPKEVKKAFRKLSLQFHVSCAVLILVF